MPRLFLEVKSDDSAETWTMEGGRQYLVIKKEEIVNALDGDGIDEECLKIKEIGRKEAKKEMDDKITAAQSWGRTLGRSDAWVLANRIVCIYTNQQRKGMFGTADIREIMREQSYAEASDKVNAYLDKEQHREARVKDYVSLPNHKLFGKTGVDIFWRGVVIRRVGGTLTVLRCDGVAVQVNASEVKRTGIICENLGEFLQTWKED